MHDRQKLRRCAQEMAAEFGTALPPGLEQDRGAERFNDPPQPSRAEKAMQARSGLSREERREIITACYRTTDNAQAFVNALEAAGFMLARGNKRRFVVVDTAGDVHSLARQINGAKTKDIRKKLEGLTLSLLPPVERAKVLMLQRAAAQQDAARSHSKKKKDDTAAYERVLRVQKKRRADMDLLWQQMKIRHMHERKVLLAHIKAEKERRLARRHWLAMGLAPYLKKIAVLRQLIEYYEKRRKRSMEAYYRALIEGLRRRHDNEAAELQRRYQAIERLERREAQTFSLTAVGRTDRTTAFEYKLPSRKVVIACKPEDFAHGYRKPVDVTGLFATDVLARVHTNATDVTQPPEKPASDFSARMTVLKGSIPLEPHDNHAKWDFRINAVDITTASSPSAGLNDDKRTSGFHAPPPTGMQT